MNNDKYIGYVCVPIKWITIYCLAASLDLRYLKVNNSALE